jgi:four helix bundle protein
MKSYRELKVWHLAMNLVVAIYKLTGRFPKSEVYGLTAQLQRAGVSVPSNIAEGHARDSTKEFLRHVSIAMGSLAELETQLLLARRLGFASPQVIDSMCEIADELGRMLRGLQKSLKAKAKGRV